MTKRLTDEEADTLRHWLEGTCNTIRAGLRHMGVFTKVNPATAIDQMLDQNLENCKGCNYWMESCELVDEESESVGLCEQCRPKKKEVSD